MLGKLDFVLKNLVRLVVLSAIGYGAWFAYQVYYRYPSELKEKNAEIARQAGEIKNLQENVERLELSLKLLKVDRRMAQVVVLGQSKGRRGRPGVTRFRFVEVDRNGEPLGKPQEHKISGDVLYIDSWVVKFEDLYVEQGDPLRSASLCLLRRLFGENQKPSEGFVLDEPDRRPAAYGGDTGLTALEKQVWSDFWSYANDPDKAAKLGIRAAHGEAPSMKLKKGYVYKITLRSSGGLTIAPEKVPSVLAE